MILIERLFITKHRNAAEKAVAADIPNLENSNIDKPSLTPSPIIVTGITAESVIKGVVR